MHSKRIQLGLFAFASLFLVGVHFASGLQPPAPPPVPTPVPTLPTPAITYSQPPVPSPTPVPTNPPPVNPDQSIPVVITYGQGVQTQVQITRGIMEPVGIPPNQPVTVTLFLTSGLPGTLVQLGLYDGGQVGPPALPGQDIINSIGSNISLPAWPGPKVSTNGTLQFNFQSAPILGLYRVLLTIGPKQYLLQFYAVRPRVVASPLATPTPMVVPPGG